jgi:RND family efflux transporter MFP subunit
MKSSLFNPATTPITLLILMAVTACTKAPQPAPIVPVVYVSTVNNDKSTSERVFFGHLQPRHHAALGFRVGGKVISRDVELGQNVKAGQIMGRLDPADFLLSLEIAQAQARAAEVEAVQSSQDASRMQRLLKEGSVSTVDTERQQSRAKTASAQLEMAWAQVELAQNRANYTELKAPHDGVVTAIHFEVGQSVSDTQAVIELAQTDQLEVQVDLPESILSRLTAMQARAQFGYSTSTRDAGTEALLILREISPSASVISGTYRAHFSIPALPANIKTWLGMPVELRLSETDRVEGTDLPIGALLATNDLAVWVVNKHTGVLERTPVRLLSQTSDHVRLAGLPNGAQVVSAGAQKLDAGLQVQAVSRPGEWR